MIFFYPGEKFFRGMSFFPFSGCKFVHLGQSRISMNRAENFIQTEFIFHSQNIFRQQVSSMGTDNCHSENFICAGFGEDFNPTAIFAVRNGSVQIINPVARDFKWNVLLLSLGFIETDSGNSASVKVHHGITRLSTLKLLNCPNKALTAAYQA